MTINVSPSALAAAVALARESAGEIAANRAESLVRYYAEAHAVVPNRDVTVRLARDAADDVAWWGRSDDGEDADVYDDAPDAPDAPDAEADFAARWWDDLPRETRDWFAITEAYEPSRVALPSFRGLAADLSRTDLFPRARRTIHREWRRAERREGRAICRAWL